MKTRGKLAQLERLQLARIREQGTGLLPVPPAHRHALGEASPLQRLVKVEAKVRLPLSESLQPEGDACGLRGCGTRLRPGGGLLKGSEQLSGGQLEEQLGE